MPEDSDRSRYKRPALNLSDERVLIRKVRKCELPSSITF